MTRFTIGAPEPVHVQVGAQIKEKILREKLQPGDALPNYKGLCEEFNVCPVTLKRALEQLYREEVVYSRRGKGIFVHRGVQAVRKKLSQVGLAYGCAHQTFFNSKYMIELFQGVMLEADLVGAGVRAFSLKSLYKQEKRLLNPDDFLAYGIDGVILLAITNDEYISQFVNRIPTVLVDYHTESLALDCVAAENTASAKRVVDHLVELGHRRIDYVDGWAVDTSIGNMGADPVVETSDTRERRDGYCAAMKAHDLEPMIQSNMPKLTEDGTVKSHAPEALRVRLASPDRPTAFVTYDSKVGGLVLEAAAQNSLRVPEDVSVAVVVGAEHEQLGDMRATYNRLSFVNMGEHAIRALDERCRKPRIERPNVQYIETRFVSGETTAPVKS